MKRTILATIAISAVAGAVVIPSLALGNARRTTGSLSGLQAAETPYVAQLKGSNEVPTAGDPDGTGAATVSFDVFDAVDAEVCWDLSYTGIGTPTAAHIHPGAAGTANPPIVDFGVPGATSDTGCTAISATLADEIMANPANYYVNVHTTDYSGGALRGQLAKGPEAAGSQHFLPTPLRAYDSRIAPATKMAASETRTVSLATGKDTAGTSLIAVPPGATAAIVTITATETSGASFLKAYSAASPEPATSNVNFTVAGATVAVSTQVAVDASGSIKLTAGPAGTHVIVDVVGYLY
jgi:CHRD domain